MLNIYDGDLDRNAANYAPLSPLTFLSWVADVYPQRPSIIHGTRRFTWSQTQRRCAQLAAALKRLGIGRGDTVTAMLSNTPEMLEAHFGVPMSGAVLHALNTRLDADALAFMMEHAETKVLLVDREFSAVMSAALAQLEHKPLVIDVLDAEYQGPGAALGKLDYEALLREPEDKAVQHSAQYAPPDEWDAIALSYTSGTTGNPKGVVYHHRGAHLNALGNVVAWGMPKHAVYLWTLPMFHCNGWCFPWSLAAIAGTSICLRKVEPARVFELMAEHKVTHYCGAPIVHASLVNAPEEQRAGIKHTVKGLVGGAAPPAAMIEGMQRMGFDLTHVYGLTEVYGPASVCPKHEEWQRLDVAAQAERNGRQGVRVLLQDGMVVMDPETMQPVPADGETIGEIMFRGNLTMKGYLKNPKATSESFAGGWFHSGDLAVLQPDGYVKVKDRAKDIIISGGENISSLEIEDALYRHPAVLAAAVVAQPDPKWGESPCAFVELKPKAVATEAEMIEHCRARLAHFKAPRRVIFGEVPKTSTGKIQKFLLRARVKSSSAIE